MLMSKGDRGSNTLSRSTNLAKRKNKNKNVN